MFDHNWFIKHQKALLWFCNTPLIKYPTRWLLEVRDEDKHKIEWSRRISGITENIICFDTGRNNEKGERLHRCHVWGRAGYAEFIAWKLRWIWMPMHIWDFFADKYVPALSFGLTDYNPSAGGAGDVVDGALERDEGGVSFATIRARTTASAAYPSETNVNACYMAKSGSNFTVLIRGVFGFYNLTTFVGTIATAVLKLNRTNSADSFGGMSIVMGKATPTNVNNLVVGDFDIATKFTLTRQAADIDIDDFAAQAGNWTLNATGVASCQAAQAGDGKLMLATLHSADFDNSNPSAGGDGTSLCTVDTRDHATSANWPTLTVEVAVSTFKSKVIIM